MEFAGIVNVIKPTRSVYETDFQEHTSKITPGLALSMLFVCMLSIALLTLPFIAIRITYWIQRKWLSLSSRYTSCNGAAWQHLRV